ncbi:hypothetical protein [Polymorphobacter megasporae]|uniref:hypothetical protein n=1 Tax=Glacieibacterium megasporae TaxID=2835787 RepID=UPI001C1DCFBD|nr:hypothetical protein [Polymorphobacter megasporae]UAJ08797.1 hypothetical protein KTC28_10410 [Polymorphobacter megasporae]
MRRVGPVIDADRRDLFIAALRDCGAVSVAADRAGASRFAFRRARDHHPDFAVAWDTALGRVPALAVDPVKLEKALFKRLLNGVKRRTIYQGKVVDIYRVFNDPLAFKFVVALLWEKYAGHAADAPEPVELMTREAFLAAIAIRPRTIEQSAVEQSAVEQGAIRQRAIEQGALEQNTLEQVLEQGAA